MNPQAYTEMAQVQAAHWWYAARREILHGQLERLHLPPGADILEVGSGTGANLDLLAGFGNVVALEMTPEAIALAEARDASQPGRVTMRQGHCPEDLAAITQRFDLICLFDVLEHIENDVDSLARLPALLKPGGRLMLTVPAYQWMWGPHDEYFHHKRRYDCRLLADRCRAAHLAVARLDHFNTLLFPLAVLDRLVAKLTGRRSCATRVPPRPLNAVLHRVFGLERHLLDHVHLPFGLSIFLLAQPQVGT